VQATDASGQGTPQTCDNGYWSTVNLGGQVGAMAAPWYFNPKGLSGPYPKDVGPRGAQWKITPGQNTPGTQEDWIDEHMAELLKNMAELWHMLAEGSTEISVPAMVNPCPPGSTYDLSSSSGVCRQLY